MQQLYPDFSQGMNAFSQGMAIGQQRQDNQAIGSAFASGDLQGAQKAAFSAGQSDLGLQIQRLKQVASAEQQALVAQSSQRLGQSALALRDNYRTPQERAQAAQQLLPPQVAQALPQGFDFSDQSLTAMAQMQMTLAEQLKQSARQSDLGLQIQRLKQVASAEQQALVAQSSQRLGQSALALRDNYRTPQERAQAAQQLLPPQVAQALPQGFDFSDQSLTAMAQMQMTLAEQLKQSETEVTKFGDSLFGTWTNNITRDMQVEELGQRGPTYSEKTGRQNADAATLNADTSRGRLELDVQNAGRQGSRPPSVKPLTEREGRFGMFARVASEANQILSSIETQNNFDPTLIVPDRGNMARSPDAQQYLAEKSAFIDAIIRPKTGAAVTEYEFSAAEKRYFPQFGDSPQTVQNKAALRQREIDALLLGAGRGSSIAEAAQQASQGGDSDPLGIR